MGNNGIGERYQVENQDYDFAAVLNCSLPPKKRAVWRPDKFRLLIAQKFLSRLTDVRPPEKKLRKYTRSNFDPSLRSLRPLHGRIDVRPITSIMIAAPANF
jgi:hypothetical protein